MNSILLLILKDCFFDWHYKKTQWQNLENKYKEEKKTKETEPWECGEYLLQTSVFHVKRPKLLQRTGRKISSKVMGKRIIFMCFIILKSISQEVTMFHGYRCFKFWECPTKNITLFYSDPEFDVRKTFQLQYWKWFPCQKVW